MPNDFDGDEPDLVVQPLPLLIGRRILGRGDEPATGRALSLLHPPRILYVFTSGDELHARLSAPWLNARELPTHRIYARTRTGVYLLSLRTLDGLARGLGFPFTKGGRSLVVNLRKAEWMDYEGGLLRLGFITDDANYIEYVTIKLNHSRRIYRLLSRFQISLRRGSSGGNDSAQPEAAKTPPGVPEHCDSHERDETTVGEPSPDLDDMDGAADSDDAPPVRRNVVDAEVRVDGARNDRLDEEDDDDGEPWR